MRDVADHRPDREVRAAFTDKSVTVYQAFGPRIAEPALRAGTFVPPFGRERMTWVKPSFLWMMHRSGWATKPDQERVLAVEMSRGGLEWALARSCLASYDPTRHASREAWQEALRASPVRIQWDPERSLRLDRLDHRTIQVGLSGEAAHRYVDDWVLRLTDVTPLAHQVRDLVTSGALDDAAALLPVELPYPLPDDLRATIGAS